MIGKKIGLVAAQSKLEAEALGLEIGDWLKSRSCQVVTEHELVPEVLPTLDAIVVLGGDGLMMRAAHSYPDVPLLGINFGKVGFLALVERRDWHTALEAMLAGNFSIDESSTLSASIERDHGHLTLGNAINDVVIRGGVRMIDVEVYIDVHFVNTYPGDGMIVSTSRGSTAYCMAAGGPILTAGVRGFAIVPISCHSPIRTPFVAAESAQVELVLANKHEASLILDGRIVTDLEYKDVVRVTKGPHMFRLISFGGTNFYEAFRTKFNFRIRPDAAPTRG